VSLTLSTL